MSYTCSIDVLLIYRYRTSMGQPWEKLGSAVEKPGRSNAAAKA
jgi:hypothetical protein